MAEVPLVFAFTAGLLATINPCGFAMLPAYLSFLLGLDGAAAPDRSTAIAVRTGLGVGGLVAAGFLVVFGAAALLAAVGVGFVVGAMPWVAMVVGVGVVALGGWLLAGRTLPVPAIGAGRSGGVGGALGFGVSYALASLSCTLPVLLTVVAAASAQPSLTGRLATVAAYLGGMTLLLLAVTVALSLGKASLVRRLRALTPALQRSAGVVLVLAGTWVVGYWAVILAADGPARQAAALDRTAGVVTDVLAGAPGLTAAVAVAVLVLGLTAWWRDRRRSQRPARAASPVRP